MNTGPWKQIELANTLEILRAKVIQFKQKNAQVAKADIKCRTSFKKNKKKVKINLRCR